MRHDPTTPPEAPPIVRREVVDRQNYVHVPTVDRMREALEEALAREAKTFARHAPIVERIMKTAEQIHAGRQVNERNAKPTGFGLGWTDEP